MGPHRAWQPPLQQAGGTDDQVLFIRHPGDGRAQGEQAGSRQGVKLQPVAVVQEDEQGLQLVIAVGAAAVDVQEEVELGRRRPAVRRLPDGILHHGARVHWLICNLRRLPWPVMVSRCGSR